MNQQRSRRFRSSREAKEKEEVRKESVALWKCMSTSVLLAIYSVLTELFLAMGKEVLDDEKSQESWDSNAITPGTPFMHLLASSLRYWVAQKMNMDPGWKDVSASRYVHEKVS
jgi:5'-3' exoribonuclease 2